MSPHLLPDLDRRGFVSACASCAAALLLGGCASLVTHPVPVSAGHIRLRLSAYPELGTRDGAIRIQPDGVADPLYVLATGDGAFTVVSPICTHLGCTVDVHGERLVCPCHGSTYDRAGNVLKGPAQRALTRYPTAVSGDELTITLATS